jgi:hypothetical protein
MESTDGIHCYRHLGNSVLNVGTGQGLESLGRPTLMITNANNADVALPKRKSRDNALFSKYFSRIYLVTQAFQLMQVFRHFGRYFT